MAKRRAAATARAYVIAGYARGEGRRASHVAAENRRARTLVASRRRMGMCAVAFMLAFALLGVRLGAVALSDPASGRTLTAGRGEIGDRGEIVDRNGVLLAVDLPMRGLEISGREVWNASHTAYSIASIFPEIDARRLERQLAAGRYVAVRPSLTPAREAAVFALGLPGVRFSPRLQRFYPHGAMAAHVLGYTEPGKGGVAGLEKVLDARRGEGPFAASIDIRAQAALEQELAVGLTRFRAKAAMAAVMDVATGEVLALASLPDFDPNAPGAAPADSRRNRAVYDRYEMGSAFKLFTAAAALEAGTANEQSTYDARGYLRVADRVIRDFHGENRVLTFSEVIQHSSNIGAARMAADLGVENQRAALKEFGLLEALPIELPERRSPDLPNKWGPVESATIAYGHGIAVTPLHLLAAVAAVVNGGLYHPPTFIARKSAPAGRRVISEEASLVMRRVMRDVVTGGTAGLAEVAGYFPIGKTATADKPSRGGYDEEARLATFVGAFPGHAPRYVVLVTFDDPQAVPGTYGYATAGWNAAPVFASIANRLAPILGVSPVSETDALIAFWGLVAKRKVREARLSLTERAEP